jgi:hypothetical protein
MYSKKKIKKIERTLQADIRWAVKTSRFNPGVGALQKENRFEAASCGVCAVGARACRAGNAKVDGDDIDSAARTLETSYDFANVLYFAVDHGKDNRRRYDNSWWGSSEPEARALGYRLRDYGDAVQENYNRTGQARLPR